MSVCDDTRPPLYSLCLLTSIFVLKILYSGVDNALLVHLILDSCPDDSWLFFNNECFKVFGSPGFYGNASTKCQETGGTLLSYESRHVLRDLNVTSSTWLRSPVKIDNVTSELFHYESRQQNSTTIQSCPSFLIDSSFITFSCDKQSTTVCQFRDSTTGKARGKLFDREGSFSP